MSAGNDCNCACPTPEVVQVPGSPGTNGTPGAAGAPGVSSFTLTTTPLLIPIAPGPVAGVVGFANTNWMAVGQIVFISDGVQFAHFRVLTIPSPISATLQFLNYAADNAPGLTILVGAKVVASGTQPILAAPLPFPIDTVPLTSNGAVDNALLSALLGIYKLCVPFTVVAGVAASEVITNYTINHRFRIIDWSFVTAVAVTGGSRNLNMEIGLVDVGTAPSILALGAAAIGTIQNGTPVIGANIGVSGAQISIEIQAGGVAWGVGSGFFYITLQNLDTADAIANLSKHINDILTSLN